jgi:hypothetical protein
MKQRIVGYHVDAEGHWIAKLECGHQQHVRHAPPFIERPWVVTEEGRASRFGEELNCTECDGAVRREGPWRPWRARQRQCAGRRRRPPAGLCGDLSGICPLALPMALCNGHLQASNYRHNLSIAFG